jgi:hypothetical protein
MNRKSIVQSIPPVDPILLVIALLAVINKVEASAVKDWIG